MLSDEDKALPKIKRCPECGEPALGYSVFCQPCHFDAFEGGADIG